MQVIRDGPHAAALSKKFLSGGHGSMDYSPMQALLDAPLHDVGAESGPTVPTRINADKMHFAQLRLDYVLINERLHAACGWRACSRHAGEAAGAAHRAKLKTENKL